MKKYRVNVNGNVYETIKHVAKGLNLNHVQLPDEIRNKIDLKNYIYKGK